MRIGNLGRDLLAYNPTLTEEFVRGEKTRLTNLLEGKVATAERRLQHTARPTPTYSQPSYHQQQPVASSAARRNPDALRSQQAESGRNFFSELHNQIEGLYDQVEALSGDAKRQKELNGYVTTDTKNEIKKLLSEASDLLEIVGGETPASYSDIISQADELLSDEPQTSTPPYNPDYRPAGLQKSPSLWAAGDWASDEISKIKSQLAKLSKPGGDPAFKLLALKEVISELDDLVRPTSREGLEEQKGQVDSLKQDAETLKDTLEKDSVVANLQSRYNTIASLPSGDEQYLLAIELNQDLNPEGYTKLDKEQKAELDNIAGELNKIIESYDSFFDSPALQASSIQDQKIAALEQLIKPLQGYQYNSSVGKEASKLLNSKAKPTNFTGLTRAQTIKLNQLRDTLAEIVRQNSDAQSPAPLQRHDSIATTATRWEGAISYEANESQTEFRKLRESYSRLAENLHDIDKGNPNNFDTLIEIRKELNSLRNKVRELAQHSDSFNSQQHNSQQGEIVRLQRNIDDSIADATKAISNIEQYLLGGR